jgi:type VI secretion system protein ImpJ
MFLRPQHFQASDRHRDEQVILNLVARDPCGYGVVHLEIDPGALVNRQIEIRACRAMLKDGTLVWLEPGEEPDRVGIDRAPDSFGRLQAAVGDALAIEDRVKVYLAVPRLQASAANVGSPGSGGQPRFAPVRRSLADQTSGSDEQEVELLRLNYRILLSGQDLSGYEVIPIAQVRRTASREWAPEIDPEYFPPMLSIDAWGPLGRDIVRHLYRRLGQKIEVLAGRAVSRNVTFESSEPGDLHNLLMLSKCLEAQAVLRVVAFAPGIHPRTAYLEMCRIAGQLGVFDQDRRLEELPPYDHDDLAGIFGTVRDVIHRILDRVETLTYEQRRFVGTGAAKLEVRLEQKWLESDWVWYVGVVRGHLTEEECRSLLTQASDGRTMLDWKIASARQVETFFKSRTPGVHLKRVEPPAVLPQKGGWVYYEIGRDRQGAQQYAWQDIKEDLTLAICVADRLVLNKERLPGSHRLEVLHDNSQTVLEFSLFAVPKTP